MQTDIHPKAHNIKVSCSCGAKFESRSTLSKDLALEICSACHPFYTGTQKMVDTAGRIDKFNSRYKKK